MRTRLLPTRLSGSRRATTTGTALAVLIGGGLLGAAPATADPDASAAVTAAQRPGSVFTNETLDATALPAGAATGQRYAYWTTGLDRKPQLAVATLVNPQGTAPAGGWPVVVAAPAGNGLADDCAPSLSRQTADRDRVTALLRRGLAVITPDYRSIGASTPAQYVDRTVTARNLLDSVAAGVVVDGQVAPRWAAVGDGEGAGAVIELTRRASEWQGPGLDFRGGAASSIPAGLDDVLANLGPASPAASEEVTADVVYALASVAGDGVERVLSARGRELVGKAKTVCAPGLRTAVRGMTLGQLMSRPLSSAALPTDSLPRSLTLPTTGFDRPIMLSQVLQDDAVLPAPTVQYLANAQLASDKVRLNTYFTGDKRDAERQEDDAVAEYVDGLL